MQDQTSAGAFRFSKRLLCVGRPLLSSAELHTQPARQPSQQLHHPQDEEHIWREVRNAQGLDGTVVREGIHPVQ